MTEPGEKSSIERDRLDLGFQTWTDATRVVNERAK